MGAPLGPKYINPKPYTVHLHGPFGKEEHHPKIPRSPFRRIPYMSYRLNYVKGGDIGFRV